MINYFKHFLTIALISLVAVIGLTACDQKKEADNVVTVGIIDGPDTPLWEAAKAVALKREGLIIQLVKFSDYNMPNEALNNGEIDANAFQHVPFLEAQIKAHGYHLVAVANTFVYPMALYSKKIQRLDQMRSGDKIAIPNDPSNEARALLILQKGGLIVLNPSAGVNATTLDIAANPKHLKIVEMDAAQLPRVLPDVVGAVITNDYADPAGLTPKQGILVEDIHSPYMNVIVVRPEDKDSKKIKQLIAAFQSPEVKNLSGDYAIAGW